MLFLFFEDAKQEEECKMHTPRKLTLISTFAVTEETNTSDIRGFGFMG